MLFSHCLLTLFAKKNSSRKLKNTFVNNYCSVVGYTHNQIRQDSFKKQPIIVDALNEIHFLIVNNNTTVYIYIYIYIFIYICECFCGMQTNTTLCNTSETNCLMVLISAGVYEHVVWCTSVN